MARILVVGSANVDFTVAPGTVEAARAAAREVGENRVLVVESGSVCVGLGLLALALLAAAPSAAGAAGLAVEIAPSPGDPAEPRMGDQLTYHATIRNDGSDTASGIVVWLSLLRADPGLEAPVDLEDWSAQKAVKLAALAPGEA